MHQTPSLIQKFILSPVTILIIIGFISIGLNLYLFSDSWGEEHTVYASGIISFVVAYLSTRVVLYQRIAHRNFVFKAPKQIVKLYWTFGLVCILISTYLMVTVGLQGEGDFGYNLRYRNSYVDDSLYGASYFAIFSTSLALYYAENRQIRLMIISLLPAIFASMAMGARGPMVLAIVAVGYVYCSLYRVELYKIFLVLLLILLLLVMVAATTGKLELDGMIFLLPYISYGLTSLKIWYIGLQPTYCPGLVLGTYGAVFEYLIGMNCGELSTGAPDGVPNVYTYAYNPYYFGGIYAVVGFMALIGAIYAILMVYAMKRKGVGLAMLGLLMYPILMIHYSWLFSLTSYLYFFLAMIPLFNKRVDVDVRLN